jgi:serralysin
MYGASPRLADTDPVTGIFTPMGWDYITPTIPRAAKLPTSDPTAADTVGGDITTTATLTVGAAPILSAIDTIADQDFYRITLVAGHEYQIGMYSYTPTGAGAPLGPTGVPLQDSFLELYDSAGNIITSADGGADTTINGVNSGFDALLSFTATTSGTYYVNARAFDNIAADGDRGDMIGDYGLYAKDVTDEPGIYRAYYDPNSPLYAIDWGTRVNRVHQTYANPDGNEGPRATGNPQSPVDPGAASGHPGKNVISIYFARAGDVFVSNDPTNPGLPPATITATGVQQFEHDAVMIALGEFTHVADIVYVEVNDRAAADFIYTSYIGTPGPGISLLGSMSPPDESDEGLAQFNSGDYRWNATDLQQGGFSFTTLIHEFGHGHGLAHPHDNGGHSGIMHGVQPEGAGVADYTTGDFHLNQGVFTMMSYEDGWQDSPYGNAATNVGYGYLGGLMAFDIAAIQDKYGVNEDWATGDDTYELKDVNAAGTYFSSIWDAGGTDRMVYNGSRDALIDLRAATLQYEVGGGGRVSYATGIFGGFTIANGVVIENAQSGSGNDTINGNDVANTLDGGAGNDMLYGFGGNDTLIGGLGNDVLDGGSGIDVLRGGDGFDTLRISAASAASSFDGGDGTDTLDVAGAVTLTGSLSSIEAINFQPGASLTLTGAQFSGALAIDTLFGGAGSLIVNLAPGDNFYGAYMTAAGGSNVTVTINGSIGSEEIKGVREIVNIIDGGDGGDAIRGGALGDTIIGGDGDDKLMGARGADTLTGGAGADTFRYQAVLDSGLGANADHITDFVSGTDKLGFVLLDANPNTPAIDPFAYIDTQAFHGTGAGEIRYETSGADIVVQVDANGDGVADMAIYLNGLGGGTLASGDFLI